jgi:hypothetical protein
MATSTTSSACSLLIPTLNPMTIQYRYKLPTQFARAETRSFGIEPYKVQTGRKAGKAVVRLVMHNHVPGSDTEAMAVADRITELLNAGGTYAGPKTLRLGWQHRHTPESVEGCFL